MNPGCRINGAGRIQKRVVGRLIEQAASTGQANLRILDGILNDAVQSIITEVQYEVADVVIDDCFIVRDQELPEISVGILSACDEGRDGLGICPTTKSNQ